MIPKHITNPNPDIYLSDNYLVIDFETTNLDKGSAINKDNRLLYTSIYHSKKGWIRVKGNEHELSNYLDLMYEVDFIVAHNAKFELQWLVRAGLDLSKVLVYDTMLGEYVRAGNRRWRLSLDETAGRYEVGSKDSYISLCIKHGLCPSTLPPHLLAKYCDQDVNVTHKVFLKQRHLLSEEGLLPVFFTRCIFTPVVAEMEAYGLQLDCELVSEIHNESLAEYNELIEELNAMTGGINMASPVQVADYIYNKLKFDEVKNRYGKPIRGKPNKLFPDGLPKTDVKTISALLPKTKKQKRFLELKGRESKIRKKISSYTNTFSEACENSGGLVYGKINQANTKTHRLSSSKPNLQNIERGLKKVVTTRNLQAGWKVRQNDYAQLEYRVAGFLAQCPVALECINNGEDPHYLSASMLFGEEFTGRDSSDPIYKELRNRAKADTFKPLYGGMTGSKKQVKYYKAFLEKHTGIAAWHYNLMAEAMAGDQVKTITGLTFYFPNTEYTHSGYILNSTNIKNYPVQMFATADIATIGTTLLWHQMKEAKLKSFIVNEVHDSVVIEQHPDEEEVLSAMSDTAMCDDVITYLKQVYDIDYNFPLTIDQEINDNWGYDKM